MIIQIVNVPWHTLCTFIHVIDTPTRPRYMIFDDGMVLDTVHDIYIIQRNDGGFIVMCECVELLEKLIDIRDNGIIFLNEQLNNFIDQLSCCNVSRETL